MEPREPITFLLIKRITLSRRKQCLKLKSLIKSSWPEGQWRSWRKVEELHEGHRVHCKVQYSVVVHLRSNLQGPGFDAKSNYFKCSFQSKERVGSESRCSQFRSDILAGKISRDLQRKSVCVWVKNNCIIMIHDIPSRMYF